MFQKIVFVLAIILINSPSVLAQNISNCENIKLATSPQIERFRITPDGNHLVYAAGQLYKAPLDGTGTPLQISGEDENDVGFFTFTPDNQHLVYINALKQVYITQYDGGTSVELNQEQELSQGITELEITPDGRYIVYRNYFDIYSVPTDGSSDPVMLNNPVQGNPTGEVKISPDSSYILYVANEERSAYDLYSVPINRSSDPLNLTASLSDISSVDNVENGPDRKQITFTVRGRQTLTSDSYIVPIDGSSIPEKINPLKIGEVTQDGRYIIHIAATDETTMLQKTSYPDDTTTVTLDQSLPSMRINRFKISPDGMCVVYDMSGGNELTGILKLYSTHVDGSKPPILLDGDFPPGGGVLGLYYGEITAKNNRLVYVTDRQGQGIFNLSSVSIDGSTAPILLEDNIFIDENNSFGAFLINNTDYAIYRIQNRTGYVIDLYAVSIDGGIPIKINRTLERGSFVFQYIVSPDNRYVIYTVLVANNTELYSAYCPFLS